jgi:hypothetical protein
MDRNHIRLGGFYVRRLRQQVSAAKQQRERYQTRPSASGNSQLQSTKQRNGGQFGLQGLE